MLSKDKLREEFSKEYKNYYMVDTFQKHGFERKRCTECSKNFWTADPDRELCGDSEHEPYSFFREKPRHIEYVEFWKKFAGFFDKAGHSVIDKYPVVSRWRQDLYFTIASIQDFQRIENGRMTFEYQHNPLIVPQICLRFNDVQNVGVTGRHLTSFMMAGQHAFNYPKEGYWRDRTIELNFGLLRELLGLDKKSITYIEDVWAMNDFSEYGPCLESFSNGLEMVNSVFTQFEYANNKVYELGGKVVDVGWGFERLIWMYAGTETAYDALFKRELDQIYKQTGFTPDPKLYSKIAAQLGEVDLSENPNAAELEARMIKKAGISEKEYRNTILPMQAIYTIVDHTRTLLFAINDGALPSNVGGGYNLRILLRRIFDIEEKYRMDIDLMGVITTHAKELKPLFKEIDQGLDEIASIIDIEKKRYTNTKHAALKLVTSIIEKGEALTTDRLKILYESNGITPGFINAVASEHSVTVRMPEDTYTKLMKGDAVEKHKKKQLDVDTEKLPKTEKLYYKDFASEADAVVLKISGNYVMLDKTPFYPEGGGQDADSGTIQGIEVTDVQSLNGVIVHVLKKSPTFKQGSTVHCSVNVKRRARLMAHHTATHLLSAAARSILGNHAWQEGAHKSADKAHIEIAHYEKLTPEQVKQIEDKANEYLLNGIKVMMREMDRGVAESKFGFAIYQGHGVPASKLRIVEITDLHGKLIDAEACGGLHAMGRESIIGIIKITAAYRPHDGIDRLDFVAGPAALEYIESLTTKLNKLAKISDSSTEKLEEGVASLLKERDSYKESYNEAAKLLVRYIAEGLLKSKSNKIVTELNFDRKLLREIATTVADKRPGSAVLLYNKRHELVCVSSGNWSALEFIKEAVPEIKQGARFIGGGDKRIAEGALK